MEREGRWEGEASWCDVWYKMMCVLSTTSWHIVLMYPLLDGVASPSEVELALETTFARDKKRFQYADVNHDGGVDNEEFVYFLHPEYNKEAVRGKGEVCVHVCGVCEVVPFYSFVSQVRISCMQTLYIQL